MLSIEVSYSRVSNHVQNTLKSIILGLENTTSKDIYETSSQTMEKWSQKIHTVFIQVFVNISYFASWFMGLLAYYTTDAKEETLKLPVVMW